MSNLVGRVHFNSTIDGKQMPRDAERVGMQAGRQGAKGFNEEWDKEFRKGLTAQGRRQLDHWKRRGSTDGLAYGRGLEIEIQKFSTRLNRAFDSFQGLNVDSKFMDTWIDKSRDWDSQLDELNDSLRLLQRQGSITDRQFENSTRIIDDWARSQSTAEAFKRNLVRLERIHAGEISKTNREWVESESVALRMREALMKLSRETGGINLKWSDLSHNARQWTLIIGAVTAAIPELAGLSSAAGSGLFTLAGGAAAAGVGLGTTISAVLGMTKALDKLPPEVLEARKGFDEFRDSFSELNNEIISAAFADSEQSWRSLASTIRGTAPAFAVVGATIGDLLDDLANGLAPGTKNFENLLGFIASSAPLFEQLLRSVGRLGEGLLSSFNNPEMQRSMREMLEWIDDLTGGFADFLEGNSFDDWLRHGRAVFGSFGELLNTTGRLLNDLVTPESINRLTTFMDNIGTFLNTGGRGILEFADELNAFGVIAEILADVGTALEPIREPIVDIGEAISGALIPAVEGASVVVNSLAQAAAPAIQALADLANAVPDEAWAVLGGGLASVGAGLLLLKGVGSVAGLVNSVRGIAVEGGKATSSLGRVGRAAGLIGGSVVGVLALADGLESLQRSITGIEDKARNAVAGNDSLSTSYESLGKSAFGASYGLTDISGALDMLKDVGTGIEDFFPTFVATFSDTGRQASQLAAALGELDKPIADLANTSVSAASEKFSAWAQELGATDQQALNMLNSMPAFKKVLEEVSLQSGELASDQDLLNLALGRAQGATDRSRIALSDMERQAGLTEDQVDSLADSIRGFANENLSARDAERQFEQALDDLTDSVKDNGTSLDINTQKGRDNQAALDRIAKSALDVSAAKLEQTGSEEEAAAAIQKGRDALIDQLEQFGITGKAAENYADDLGLIPEDITTLIQAEVDRAKDNVSEYARILANIPRTVKTTGAFSGGSVRPMASGGMLYGPQHILAGEAGIEAIVPLQRPLSQIDPAVRDIAAYAQGKSPQMASGGIVGGGVNIEAGAIIVYDRSGDGRKTATEVVTKIFERVGS